MLLTRLLNFTFPYLQQEIWVLDGATFFSDFYHILSSDLILNFIQKFILFAFFMETYR